MLKIFLAIVLLATTATGLIRLRQLGSYNIVLQAKWHGALPTFRTAGGRGWVYSHNGSPQSIDEMALSMGEDIRRAHPGQFKKLEATGNHGYGDPGAFIPIEGREVRPKK